ncbi:apoptosis regulator BAX-like isoform X2 [Xenia sp. Carnegie-2017]|uniref:apoptosis regulator BAX-like isoform X2 n=1 Tax=Xenia sp. Carnegie-2017 TaxID=2897299 RepID=UPI001F038D02|nr:apoptosis regulator BAX-like isoform X2 [Xenia sp. Carnegie-2017]
MAAAVNGQLCEQTLEGTLYKEGTILVNDLIGYKIGRNVPPVNATAKTLRKLSDDIEERNPDLLEQLCSKLNFTHETGYNSFSAIANTVFSDGIINWGRIVVLLAFSARLGRYCEENNMSDQIESISGWTARFLTDLGWIQAQGGWFTKSLSRSW